MNCKFATNGGQILINMHCAEVHGDHRNTVESMLHVNEAHDFQTRSFGK